MRVLLQRVERASASHDGVAVGQIELGLVAYVGLSRSDDMAVVDRLASKLAHLRVFEQGASKVGRSVIDVGGGVLTVSQFTLYGDTSRGRRPGFSRGAPAERAKVLYSRFGDALTATGVSPVAACPFRTRLVLDVRNWGPFTLMLDSEAP
jgi:D-aminoacyl-tRNA deacylase